MILVVTLNPALDVTHHVAGADWAGVNRPHAVTTRPGGKGANVARTLLRLTTDGPSAEGLGAPSGGTPADSPPSGDPAVLLTGLAGGAAGDALRAGLVAAGVPADLTEIGAETRRTFAVVDTEHGRTALFNEPGPPVSPAELGRFLVTYRAALPSATAVVLTGSLPAGLGPHTYADLVRLAVAAGVPVVLDTDGPALALGAAARPTIVKPNRAELERAAGRPLADLTDVTSAAAGLAGAGAGAVVVSLGPDGLLAVTGEGTWLAVPPGPADGNPTGAGDAVVAGLTWGLVSGQAWPERLRQAVALGTAAVAAPTAGDLSLARHRDLLPLVRVTRRDAP
jgi:tagatose 6-phosphate kinase